MNNEAMKKQTQVLYTKSNSNYTYNITKERGEYKVWCKPSKGKPKAIMNPAINRPEFEDFGLACYELFRHLWGNASLDQKELEM